MKKLLWTSAMALTAAACMTACDDSSSGASNSIPEFKTEAALPDTCEMEVAKVDTAYFACFENKWIEITDSATVEQFKEGLNEDEIKEKIEELEDLLKPSTPAKPKSSSSSKVTEPVDEPAEVTDDPSSSSKVTEPVDEPAEVTDDPESSDSDDSSPSSAESNSTSSATSDTSESASSTESKCGDETYNSETQFCYDSHIFDNCGTMSYDVQKEYCEEGTIKTFIITKSADTVKVGETVTIELNKTSSAIVELSEDDKVYVHEDHYKTNNGGLRIFVSNREYPDTRTRTVTLNINLTINEYKFTIPVELVVAPGLSTCGTKQYSPKTHFCDTRGSGTIYKYVTIGERTWMAENLNYQTASGSSCYDDVPDNCAVLGRLYTWLAAVGMEGTCNTTTTCDLGTGNVQGACPPGWHVPNGTEAKSLMGVDVFNTNGFNALLAGYKHDGEYTGRDGYAGFWSTENSETICYRLMMQDEGDHSYTGSDKAEFMNPVRCIKDDE